MSRVTVVGDALLDRDVEGRASRLAPDAPAPVLDEDEVRSRPGGAGLAAALAATDGHEVTLVTALGGDAGQEVAALLERIGVDVVDLGLRGRTPEKIRLRCQGTSLARWDRGERTSAGDVGPWTTAAQQSLQSADAVLVSCYGRGLSAREDVRGAVRHAAGHRPVVWDPHPGGPGPASGAAVATPNENEAERLVSEVPGRSLEAVSRRAERLARRWAVGGVAVTRGAQGALFTSGDGLPMVVPAPVVGSGDACGAGDRFAATLTAGMAAGAVPSVAVGQAVGAAASFVAAGGAAATDLATSPARPGAPSGDATTLAARVHAQGGTVVATGGCFDLLHAGHVQVLEAARTLGDCLIVYVNSDASVRRLKGPGRPVVDERDRVELLRALGCVDGVVLFDDDTPVAALEELRPDVFAKGGDYGSARIPEAQVLASWGGQAVTVPYLAGRSTTRILQEVRTRDAH